MTLDTGVKQRWVAALRSGDYVQGHGNLRTTKGFCCLGVLLDVERPGKWRESAAEGDYFVHQGEFGIPSLGFLTDIGLEPVVANNLATFNDHQGWDFNMIADYIEREL